jgi:hypothetical protein
MTTATNIVQFVSAADAALDIEERLGDLVGHIGDLNERLSQLEATLADCADADPLADLVARIDALDARSRPFAP